jgi:hypothetical protein
MGYAGINRLLMLMQSLPMIQYHAYLVTTILPMRTTTLTSEPDKGWKYGCGLNWARKLVEAVNPGMRLEELM